MGLTPRRFNREFKLEALRQLASGKLFARLAWEFELHGNVLRRWQHEFKKEPGISRNRTREGVAGPRGGVGAKRTIKGGCTRL